MDDSFPIAYISILLTLLSVVAFFLFQQIFRSRMTESRFSKLQNKLKKEKGTAEEYYELGSIYLDKKLYVQALQLLQKALKVEDDLELKNKALIYNALGFSYFCQKQYDIAIRNYKNAIKIYPEYVIALNNLGNVYEKKQLITQALECYKKTLENDSKNKIALKRVESLEKRLVVN